MRKLGSPFYSLTWVGNQASSLIQLLLARGTPLPPPPSPSSEHEQLPCPQIDNISRSHRLTEIISKHIQKPKLC